ncbi:response regulator [Flavobacterium sp. F372]|uniref:histidine kinase n=1 Tax=Flavobacterium bernardetii TaxID=2813823 RepID=A0ABR7IY90_9FLAO|nr:ATP-binding protein [Flavobacterium bernardetii]MBC5834731.1 response regulator [Flavobacterium bernardetii]NHF70379.1 response regulator [Flavobacterium bernardetii]
MKLKTTNTYSKIIILIFILSSISLLLFGGLLFYVKKQQQIDYIETKNQFKTDVLAIYKMEVLQNESYVNDIVYRDEFAKYISSRNENWFNTSVATSLNTLNFDKVIVLDKKGNVIIEKSKNPSILSDLDVSQSINNIKLHNAIRFYKKTKAGYVEVIGSGIYKSTNANKKFGTPYAYFFVVRILNDAFFNKLNVLTNSKCQVTYVPYPENDSEVSVQIEMRDEHKNKLDNFLFVRKYNNNFVILNKIIYFITLLSFLNLLIYFLFIKKWVNNPLNLVRKILENNNTKAINSLIQYKGEFGYNGKLFRNNKEQEKLLKKAKLKAEQNDKLKSVFLANLSHEIRTPMNAILGFTNLLKNDKLNSEDTKEYLETIEKSGNNLVLIINDLIEMSKIDAKQITPNYSSVDLNKCLNEIYETIKITIPEEKNIIFSFKKDKEYNKIYVNIDETKVKQILVNLITNSIKYTDSGEISFGFEINSEQQEIHFFVKDTGYGISMEDQALIFDRFKRIDNDYTTKSSGLGLGLSISKAYLDMMHGNIHLTSSIENGSTFYFSIPLEYATKKPKNKYIDSLSVISTQITSNKRILVAEDDEINYLLLTKMLSPYKNLELIRARNGKEAVDIFTNDNAFDLILLDIKMPILNGFEAFEHISNTKTIIPIIAQTAFSSSDDIKIITKTGFTDYILKPIDREKLFDLMNQYLNK